jgi:DNA-binding CsgD family transcriptional regulator
MRIEALAWSMGARLSPELHVAAAFPQRAGATFQEDVVHQFIPWGVLVVTDEQKLLFANTRARAILRSRCGIEDRSGTVHIERGNVDRTFRQLVRSALAAPGEGRPAGQDDTIGVPHSDGQPRYVLKVLGGTDYGTIPAAIVIIADLKPDVQISRTAVARTFSLTAREAEFAELFAGGNRIEAIASRMAVTPNTARVHLRNVFAKTGCANQVELARKFALMP